MQSLFHCKDFFPNMLTPVNVRIWLTEQAWPLAVIFGLILCTYIALRFSAHRRRVALTRERTGVTEQSFAEYMEQFGFDPSIAASTYRYLQRVQRVAFPILPSDALDEDLGLGPEDVQQSIRELSVTLHREITPGLIHTPLTTVEDLLRLLQASPRAVSQGVAA